MGLKTQSPAWHTGSNRADQQLLQHKEQQKSPPNYKTHLSAQTHTTPHPPSTHSLCFHSLLLHNQLLSIEAEAMAAALARISRKALSSTHLNPVLQRTLATQAASKTITESADRVRWDYRGQRKIIPLGQWLPKIAVDAYVAPNVVLAGQVTVYDGASVWAGSVLRGDLNKISVGFCSNVQERCVLHAAWSSPTGSNSISFIKRLLWFALFGCWGCVEGKKCFLIMCCVEFWG